MLFERTIVLHVCFYCFYLCSVPFAPRHSRKKVRYKSMRGNTTVSGHTVVASAVPSLVRKVWEFAINITYNAPETVCVCDKKCCSIDSSYSILTENFLLLFFNFSGNLKAHILRVHNAPEGEPTYACSYCSCIFKKLGSLNGHIKRVHSNPEEVIFSSAIFSFCVRMIWMKKHDACLGILR